MFDFFNAKSGLPTISFRGNLIHSSYNPHKEAEKYVKLQLKDLKNKPPLILIINPGLNYIYDVLNDLFPLSRFIIIHSSSEIFLKAAYKYKENTSVWHPELEKDLLSFLKTEINEINLKGIQIFSWQPAADAFKTISDYINKTVSDLFREYNGNINTVNYFGKRYFKNIVNNSLSLSHTINFSKIEKPIVITSAGPSLEKSVDLLEKRRNSIFLLAVSSSLLYLLENNIEPDLVLTTDPGYYSTYHLKKINIGNFAAACPLTSYHFNTEQKPVMLLSQNTVQEDLLLKNFPSSMTFIPQNGTVSGSALYLALSLTEYPVFYIGLDFCTSDLKSHCMPGEFSIPEYTSSLRSNPFLNILYKKYSDYYSYKTGLKNNKTSIQLQTYSSWFNNFSSERDIYRINSSEMKISSFKNISDKEADIIIDSIITGKSEIISNVSDIDKIKLKQCLEISLQSAISVLKNNYNSRLSFLYFNNYDRDILYHFSASVYLDIYGDYYSGNTASAEKKYKKLTDSCISFFETLKANTL